MPAAKAQINLTSVSPVIGSGISLFDVEKQLIMQGLVKAGGNKTKAAKLLGITRDILRYKIKKYKLDSESAVQTRKK